MNAVTASTARAITFPKRARLEVYIGTHQMAFLDDVARYQAITRTEALRRVLDEAMARVRQG